MKPNTRYSQNKCYVCSPKHNNKWSKSFDIRPYLRHTRTVQSYLPGCANVHPHLVHPNRYPHHAWLLRPTKQHFDRFSRFCTAHGRVPILYNGPPFSHQNCRLAWGTPSNTWFLGPTRVHIPNGTSICSAVFCRAHNRDRQTDRQTERQTTLLSL